MMPRPPAECGTDGGYYRHRKTTHTEPCAACLAAHSEATSARTVNKRRDPDYKPKRREPTVPCSEGCGTLTFEGRCMPCARKAGAKKREGARRRRHKVSPYLGEWVPVNGILRPVPKGTWTSRTGEVKRTTAA